MWGLDREERMRLLRFVCTFAWTDLRVTESERAVVEKMIAADEFDEVDRAQVREWLKVPPAEADPRQVPRAHREQFIDAVRTIIVADGRIVPAERDSLQLFEELMED